LREAHLVEATGAWHDAYMRRAYTEVERERLFTEAGRSGDSLAQCARRQGISVATAYAWARARSARRGVTFARVVPQNESRTTQGTNGLTIRVAQVEIDVQRDFDAALLRAVIVALSGDEQ
jgi:transposase-like protein